MNEVLVERHDGWAEVVLNRPERKNAIVGPLGAQLSAVIEEFNKDSAVRLILLRGAGGAFCSGLDLKEFNEEPRPGWIDDFQSIWRGAHRALFNCQKPIIGALERYAINGGAALALACDLLVVGQESFLQVGEAQIGMGAPYNLAWLGLRQTESTIAKIALTGKRINGEEMEKLGLATEVVPDERVLSEARKLAQDLAGYPRNGLFRIKAVMRGSKMLDADEWFDRFTKTDPIKEPTKPRSMG